MAVHYLQEKRRGIPTKYKGIQFRSLLEVRWALFFDQMGWDYVYEPFDLEGWIPDFLLKGREDILAEVKPTTKFQEEVAEKCLRAANKGGWSGEILLLGVQPFRIDDGISNLALGWMNKRGATESWSEAMMTLMPPDGQFDEMFLPESFLKAFPDLRRFGADFCH